METTNLEKFQQYVNQLLNNIDPIRKLGPFKDQNEKNMFIQQQQNLSYESAIEKFKKLMRQFEPQSSLKTLNLGLIKLINQKKQLEKQILKILNLFTWATVVVFIIEWLLIKDLNLAKIQLWIMGASFLILIIATTLKQKHVLIKHTLTQNTTVIERGEIEDAYQTLKNKRKPIKATLKQAQKAKKATKLLLADHPELKDDYETNLHTINHCNHQLNQLADQWIPLKKIHKYLNR